MPASKRKTLLLHEKVSLIRAIQRGEKQGDVGRRYGLSPSTVSNIWKCKEKLLQAEAQGSTLKKIRKPKFEDLDKAMLKWFQKQRFNDLSITGPAVKSKAEKFAERLGITDFKASEGWLGKFKRRHNLSSGEAHVKEDVINGWLEKVWAQLKERYSPDDIFNAAETCIFYKKTSHESLKFKVEKYMDGGHSKERLTAFLAANMSGTEKRKLVVIGASRNLHFKIIKRLSVIYKANKSAWMTPQLFEEELRKWDADLKGRKILLLVDNCPGHPAVLNLRNIELAFFPDNTVNVLQPLNRGVIGSFKSHYRRKMLMEIIESEGKSSIGLLYAVKFLNKAWEEVTAATIQLSFRRARLCRSSAGTEMKQEFEQSLNEWITQFNTKAIFTAEELQNFDSIDEEVVATAELTDEEILKAVTKVEEYQHDDEQEEPFEGSPSFQEALDAAKVLEKFLLFHEDDPGMFQDMRKICCEIQAKYWGSKKIQIKQEILIL